MCGEDVLYCPPDGSALCALVRMKIPEVYEGVTEIVMMDKGHEKSHRIKRHYVMDQRVHIDAIGQSKGIPYECKLRDEAGIDTTLTQITMNENVI